MLFSMNMLLQKVVVFLPPFKTTMDTQKPTTEKVFWVIALKTFSKSVISKKGVI